MADDLKIGIVGCAGRMGQMLPSRYCHLRNRFIGIHMRTLLARAMDVCGYHKTVGMEAGVLLRLRWVCRWEIAFAERLYHGMTDPALLGYEDDVPKTPPPETNERAEFA